MSGVKIKTNFPVQGWGPKTVPGTRSCRVVNGNVPGIATPGTGGVSVAGAGRPRKPWFQGVGFMMAWPARPC